MTSLLFHCQKPYRSFSFVFKMSKIPPPPLPVVVVQVLAELHALVFTPSSHCSVRGRLLRGRAACRGHASTVPSWPCSVTSFCLSCAPRPTRASFFFATCAPATTSWPVSCSCCLLHSLRSQIPAQWANLCLCRTEFDFHSWSSRSVSFFFAKVFLLILFALYSVLYPSQIHLVEAVCVVDQTSYNLQIATSVFFFHTSLQNHGD